MQFEELRIRRMGFGPHSGKIVAELSLEAEEATTTLIITEPDSLEILAAAAEVVARAGAKQASDFHARLLRAISDHAAPESGG